MGALCALAEPIRHLSPDEDLGNGVAYGYDPEGFFGENKRFPSQVQREQYRYRKNNRTNPRDGEERLKNNHVDHTFLSDT